ncbi:hypothetical protein Gohar_010974, partial [Gossypium harknessii]|nr:hypothetical protein [Gossypium harknessii]
LLPHHLPNQSPPAIYLFPPSPTAPAVTLSQLKSSNLLNYETTPLLLIVFDATWKHAKEMVSVSEGVLKGLASRVCLDGVDENVTGGSIYDNELVLRKEPFGGCVSTLEAVARCLGVIEPNGDEVQGVLIGVLREMVRLQAGFLKPLKPRPKMLKKSKHKEEDNDQLESPCKWGQNSSMLLNFDMLFWTMLVDQTSTCFGLQLDLEVVSRYGLLALLLLLHISEETVVGVCVVFE